MGYAQIKDALKYATDTRSVIIGSGELINVASVFTQNFPGKKAAVVADENTYAVAGMVVQELLKKSDLTPVSPYIFPGVPVLYAEYENVLRVEEYLRKLDMIPVVVGSGTLNDLVKLAAHTLGREYMVVATASSMDGYSASGASISKDGFKQTFACPAPAVVLADLDIIVNAPSKMTASGYGDLLGKVTAGADWLIAETLGIETIDKNAWAIVQNPLREWTANPASLRDGDARAIENLSEGLILSGISIQACYSSRPASGAEHLISHLWEMQDTTHGLVSHGMKVGVGSIATAALFEKILEKEIGSLNIPAICKSWPSAEQLEQIIYESHPDPELAKTFVKQSMVKYSTPNQLKDRLLLIQKKWPELKQQVKSQLMTAVEIRDCLKEAGCVYSLDGVGRDKKQMRETYTKARQIRSRYTILDLAVETGLMEVCLEELFSPGGYWYEND